MNLAALAALGLSPTALAAGFGLMLVASLLAVEEGERRRAAAAGDAAD